jgi:lipoprotein Spr
MKYSTIITFLIFIFFTAEINAQDSVLDSIIFSQSDSIVHAKLIKFKEGGCEKTLEIGNSAADSLIESARKYLGMPHCMGGNGKTSKEKNGKVCIDCSGLVNASFKDLGLRINIHSAQELARYGKIVSDTSQIQKGDLLFFVRSYNTSKSSIVITHTAISLGNHLMIHASASNGVEITRTDGQYWGSRFLFATRIF